MLQTQDDWYRYEMERDDAIERRCELMKRAWRLHRSGMKIRKYFPEVGEINIHIAAQYRAEARQIRKDWR